MKRIPFGIIAGALAMLAFFGIVGYVASYIIFSGIAAQTFNTISLFEYWWMTLLFFLDILFVVGFIAMTVLYIYKKIKFPEVYEEDEK